MLVAKFQGMTASVEVHRVGETYKLVVFNNFRDDSCVVGLHGEDSVWRSFYLLKAALAEGIPF